VEVDPRVPPVSIECIDQKATEITVGWNSIANINDYTLLINGTPVTTTTNLTYNLTGLTPNDVVFFELRANSNNACPSTKDTITCIAEMLTACMILSLPDQVLVKATKSHSLLWRVLVMKLQVCL
jgi:hypothetical protein